MSAFIVLVFALMVNPTQGMPFEIKIPVPSMEFCQAWEKDTAQIEFDVAPLPIKPVSYRCEERQDGKPV